ncbi:MAG: hypothetical protein ACKVOB_05410 [Sphingomonas sp.]
MRFILLLSLLVTAGCTLSPRDKAQLAQRQATDQEQLDEALAGLTPGKPQACLNALRRNFNTKRIGDTILYVASRDLIYRTDTTGGCSTARPDDILITSTPQPSVCRGDIVRTVQPTIFVNTGSCGLGDFIPYERKK